MNGRRLPPAGMTLTEMIDSFLVSLADRRAPAGPPPAAESIREAREGRLRIRGRARSRGQLLSAPVTGRLCVAFHLTVYEWHVLRTRDRQFDVLFELQGACPFSVADESGEATIDTSKPFALDLEAERRGLPPPGDLSSREERERVIRLLEPRRFTAHNLLGMPKYLCYEEGIVADREAVSVAGAGVREVSPDGESAGPRSPPLRLVLRGTPRRPLRIRNGPGALR
jgi:hypothetical protein